jgi:phosphoribosylformylglycinamidine (FGAM) synthase PurS component
MKQPYPAVQLVERARPSEPPASFVSWEFVMWRPCILRTETETKAAALLVDLLQDVVRLRTGKYFLQDIERGQVENIVAELNEHCEDIHVAIPWCYKQLSTLLAA